MTELKTNLRYLFFPITAVFIWSVNMVVTRYVADYISPISISFYRWAIPLIILTPLLFKQLKANQEVLKASWLRLAVLALFGMVLYQGLSYNAAHYTTATNMGIINALTPVFTIFAALAILRTLPTMFAILGAIISLLGLTYLISRGHFDVLLDIGAHKGDLLMILASLSYAFYGVFLKKWPIKLPLFVSLYGQIFFAVLYHLPLIFTFGLDPINGQNYQSVFYAAIFPSILAPAFWMVSVRHIGAAKSAIFMNLIPVFTAAIAYLFLKEHWTQYHTIGGAVVILGVVIAQKSRLAARQVNRKAD